VHNLGLTIDKFEVKVYVNATNTMTGATELTKTAYEANSGTQYGYNIAETDINTIQFRTNPSGVQYFDSANSYRSLNGYDCYINFLVKII